MIEAQSMWTTVMQVIPTAAITTVVFGVLLAMIVARRQEIGKQRATAEAEIRVTVRTMRQEVAGAHQHYAHGGTGWPPPDLAPLDVGDFTLTVVDSAWHLNRRRQRKVRTVLALLVGEVRVRMAEEFGPTLGPPGHPLGEPLRIMAERERRARDAALRDGAEQRSIWDLRDPEDYAAFVASSWGSDHSEQAGAQYGGLFLELEAHFLAVRASPTVRPLDVEHKVQPVLDALDSLLACSGGSRQLGQRPRRGLRHLASRAFRL
ncbi:hypothetical protein N4G70_33635 [Streptomyces sp. ASQP_92]|uniref:hypothetical protein n=1 Tax=Streptomyces sp. ASQP_92 TaxID=2979116 RepID=UPI0021C0B8B4|nr:hypothetical protein [Streptomyces sp. ASQP_92]MCT9093772.1 hypothetical protein [Streptomyces sp. ASQP_92]